MRGRDAGGTIKGPHTSATGGTTKVERQRAVDDKWSVDMTRGALHRPVATIPPARALRFSPYLSYGSGHRAHCIEWLSRDRHKLCSPAAAMHRLQQRRLLDLFSSTFHRPADIRGKGSC